MTLTSAAVLAIASASAALVVIGAVGAYLAASKTRVPMDGPGRYVPRTRQQETFVLHKLTEAAGRPFAGQVLESLSEKQRAKIQGRIEAAGRPEGLTVERYVRRKCGEVLLYGGIAALMFVNGNTLLAFIVLGFAALTDLQLHSQAQERNDQIQRQLPDFLDVLSVTVGAGLSFRAALDRVAASMPGALSDEFRTALQQMDLGTSRREAFDALRRRNRNESLSKFVTAIQQAEELGAPLSRALVEISQDMRRADAQYMRRKAQKINPRVTAVTAVTLLPGLLLLMVGSLFLGTDIDLGMVLGG